jgi:uncharacterized membrane protein YfcA
MIFPTAGIEVQPWIPPLVAFVISFFTSMGGVSGAFLLLPFQMSFLGYTSPSVSATNQLFNIVAIPSGVYRFWKEGRMVWPLTWIVVAGTLPGVLVGAIVRVKYLPDPKEFKIFAGVVLLYIGVRMIRDLLGRNTGAQVKAQSEKKFQEMVKRHRIGGMIAGQNYYPASRSAVKLTHFNLRRFGYTFYDEQFDVSTPGIFSLSLIVGLIGGDLWHRRWFHNCALFCDVFPVACLYNCQCCTDGNFCYIGSRSSFLSDNSPILSRHVYCTGLVARDSFWFRWDGWDVSWSQVSKTYSSKSYKMDACEYHRLYSFEIWL